MNINVPSAASPAAQGKSLHAGSLPLLLSLVAVATFEIAQREAGGARWQIALKTAVISAMIVAGYRVFSSWKGTGRVPGRLTSWLLIASALLPIPLDALLRAASDSGHTLELLLVGGFRNLVCGLAMISYQRRFDRICCVASMFLIIFASAITSDPLVHLLVVLFALCGVWWLMGLYWDSLRGRLVGSTRRRVPKRFVIGIPLLFLPVLAILPLAAPQVAVVLPGWMPSSGGDKWSDPHARGGVNDGEAMVPATDDARSFGPVETDIFMESTQPSLYDVFNEMYGKPPKLQKTDRSIALPPEFLKHAHERMAKQQKLGKQFSTARRAPSPKLKTQQDVTSSALLYVAGRTPQHLRLEVFDLFDGVDWFPEEMSGIPAQLKLTMLGKQPWLQVPLRDPEDVLASPEAHQLKIINLQTNRIPSPPGLMGIHIDKVDRADMFAWAQESIVKMDRDELPDLTVIHIQSRTVRRERLRQTSLRNSSGQIFHRQIPSSVSESKLAALAKSWAGPGTNQWERIEAVVARLRETCTLDRNYRAQESCDDPITEFLFESRRGNDYMFASAAALLLRSLGHSTRLVTGFYVDPAKYEPKSRHTPVIREDVHVWLEIHAAPGTWVTLEPTPGYDVLLPAPNWWQRCLQALATAARHVWHYTWAYATCCLLLLMAWHFRAEVSDRIITGWWLLRPARRTRQHVFHTLQLLEQRCRWVGFTRGASDTASRWLLSLADRHMMPELDVIHRFSRVSDWARYAPAHQTVTPESHLREICREMVNCWTLARLKDLRTRRAVPQTPS
ncbi:MAG: Transglutaminase-like superfamily protein [Planctomycetaceae bacterium]|nr:Transglutaminase-like superfamily protein [Planctomycetaceae bacterium]